MDRFREGIRSAGILVESPRGHQYPHEGGRLLLGTTAAKIVNHADRPVLVVRPLQ